MAQNNTMTWNIGDKVVTFSQSFVEFCEENLSEKMQDLFIYMNGDGDTPPTLDDLVLDKNGNHLNYFAVRKGDDPLVSYLPAGKEHKTNPTTGAWVREGRQTMKIGKWLKSIVSASTINMFDIKDTELEKLSNMLKAWCDDKMDVSVVRGDEILKWYNSNSYASGNGNLGSSCMRYDSKNHYMKFYTEQPECSMVILTKGNKLHARAILWDIGDFKLMDRMYTEETYMEQNLIEWANENGYHHLANQSYGQTTFVNCEGQSYEGPRMQIEPIRSFEHMPYMDTFKYYKDGIIYNRHQNNCTELESQEGNYDIVFRFVSTDYNGRLKQEYVDTCALTQKTGHKTKFVRVESIGRVHENNLPTLIEMGYEKCEDEDGLYIQGCVYSEYKECTIRKSTSVFCERLDSHMPERQMILCDYTGMWEVKSKCEYSEYHNSFLHKDDCSSIRNPETKAKDFIHDSQIVKYLQQYEKVEQAS